ncbi:MAG: glycosyltransferase [Cucumibacter sp.]
MPADVPTAPPLNILQVLRAPVGGVFRHVRDLTELLAARGNRVAVVVDSIAFDRLTEARLQSLAGRAALGIHRVAMPRFFALADFSAPDKIRRLVEALSIDVVHGHGAKGGFHARLAVGRNPGVPAFYTPHGGVLHFAPGSFEGAAFTFIERRLLRRTAGIFFESEFALDAFAAQVTPPGATGTIVHNGLRPEEFETLGSTGEFDFVFVGELRALKGVDVLIAAMTGLVKSNGKAPRLLVVGDGPDRETLKTGIVRSRLSGQISLAGAMPARQAFARGNCVIVPSRRESLPYVVLEAAAAQKPLIATRVGGIPEIFGPTARRLVAGGDAGALREAMRGWLTGPDPLRAEAKQRREFVRANFEAGAMAAAIEAGYREALGQR